MTEAVRKPFFPPSADAIRRAGLTALMRTATAHVLAAERKDKGREDPVKLAERMWPGDRDVALLTRGTVGTATTSNTSALLATLTEYFIAALAPISAAAALLAKTLQLSFDEAGTISVPAFVATASGASFVGELRPISARSLVAQPLLLEPSSLKTITGLTEEMVAGSGGNAERMIEDCLKRSVALALDAALFDANAIVPEVRPAGLRNGVSASTASGATDPTDAMIADIQTLTAIVAAVSGSEPIVLIAAPARAKTMPLRSVALALNSSFVILPSSEVRGQRFARRHAVGHRQRVGLDPGNHGRARNHAAFRRQPATARERRNAAGRRRAAARLVQTNSIALKCRLPVSWAKRHPASVAWLTATAW